MLMVSEECGQFVKGPVFHCLAVILSAGLQITASGQAVDHTDIGEIKPGSAEYPTFRALPVSWQPLCEQGIFQYLEVVLYALVRYATIAGDTGKVDALTITERGHIQKIRKCRQVSHQPFRGNFLLQVVCDIGIQHSLRAAALVDARQVAVVEYSLQIKLSAQFACGETVQFVTYGSAPQQIGCAPFNLSGAGTAQRKTQIVMLHQPMDFIQ